MAAPETAALRRLRLSWQLLCFVLGGSIWALAPLRAMIGGAAPCGIAVLLVATLLATVVYWRRKQQADRAYLAGLGEGS
jgi:hypothetical protein